MSNTDSNDNPRLIDKNEAARRTGIPVSTWSMWIKTKSLPFVQPTGPGGKAYFSAALVERIVQRAEGQYVVEEPDFAAPLDGPVDQFTDLTVMEPGFGAVHQSRRAEYDRYVRARAEGKSVAEAIVAAEGLGD